MPKASLLPLATALAAALDEPADEKHLVPLRAIILASKPVLDEVSENLGTDLLCLINYRIDSAVPHQEIEFYIEQVKRGLAELSASEDIK